MSFIMTADRLASQIQFILEADRLKDVQRRSYVISGGRRENSAEHSWHIALMSMVLAEYANAAIDTLKVIRMLIVHDLVEIDADDTFIYDAAGNETKAERERLAADRIFGLLPQDQGSQMRVLWEEFESRATSEARFAAALDRMMPVLHNLHNNGRSWTEHGVTSTQVFARNAGIAEGSQELWDYLKSELNAAIRNGVLR
ncbi:MAG TPA: HD domain-containing protein [Chthoniobacterales bacterium]